jgi:glycosyltransferase involved in cell wall biosynthesis
VKRRRLCSRSLRGKLPQAEVADLYRDIDVLIAPSVWPESYGLVVREAIKAGCWVVTSDRGALAQDIGPGCGHVVSVDGYRELQEVLGQIDRNKERYLGPIETAPILRSATDQAIELAALYLGVAAPDAVPPRLPAASRLRVPAARAAASFFKPS